MIVTLQSITTYDFVALTKLFNRSFEDYTVPVDMDVAVFGERSRGDGVDLGSSRLIVMDGRPSGVALIARRGFTSRLSAMGIVSEARGRGVGKVAMRLLLDEARARDERAMVLEVIEQNPPAVRLYQGCGFRSLRRLFGYGKTSWTEEPASARGIEEIDVRQAARVVTAHAPDDLPWQASGESIVQMGPPYRAFRLDEAVAVVGDPDKQPLTLRTLAVPEGLRRQGRASRLLAGIAAQLPGRRWRIPGIVPEELGPFFERLGFERDALSQFLMRADLTAATA